TLTRSLEIPVKGATMIHDFALTSGHVIFMDLPVIFDIDLAMRGTMPFVWSDSYGARLGILPRGGGLEALRWVDVDPGYVYHVANAFESDDGTIIVDVAWYREQWRHGADSKSSESASLRRWLIRPGASKAEETQLDDRHVEFPRIDDRRIGQAHSVVYALAHDRDFESGAFSGVLRLTSKPAGLPAMILVRLVFQANLRWCPGRAQPAPMRVGSLALSSMGRAMRAISSFSTRRRSKRNR